MTLYLPEKFLILMTFSNVFNELHFYLQILITQKNKENVKHMDLHN